MRLQAPADALVAAVIGGLVLLLLYVLKLRRRPLRVATVVFWTAARADAQANEPFRRLRPSWLLALHASIIALLALAAGRPVASLGSEGSHARTVLVIDASASMNAIDSPGSPSRFDRARRRAVDEIERLLDGSSDRVVAVILAAAEPTLSQPFTSSANLAKAAIASIEPTDQPGDLAAALTMARTLASTASESGPESDGGVLLLTDGVMRADQASSLRSSLPVRLERTGPAPGTPSPLNRGITRLTARRDASASSSLGVFVEVTSTRDAAAKADLVSLNLTLEGRTLDRRTLTVPVAPGESGGAASTVIEIPAASRGLLEVRIDGPDALACDDAAAMVLDPPFRPSLLLVQPRGDAASHSLLRDVAAELDARALRTVDAAEYDSLAAARSLGGFDAVILDGVTPRAAPTSPTIAFGVDFASLGIARTASARTPDVSLYWNRSHPLLESVSLDSLVIEDDHILTPRTGVTIDPLISSNQGPLLLLTREGGVNRLIASFDLSRSNWLLQPSFPVFMAESLRFLLDRDGTKAGRSHRTTEAAFVRVTDGSKPLAVAGPIRRTVEGRAGDASPGLLSVGVLGRVGTYSIAGPATIDTTITCTLEDRDETSLTSRELPIATERSALRSKGGAAPASGRPLWGPCIMAAFALLCAEWLLLARELRS